MLEEGYIKAYRSLTKWEWYDDLPTFKLFLHLLLTANHKSGNWRGVPIKRGQRIASLEILSREANLSIQQTRTALKRLSSTGEVTSKATSKYSVYTVNNYSKYQGANMPPNTQITNKQQTTNKQSTTKEERKESKNIYSQEIGKAVIAYLNEKAGKRYTLTGKYLGHINARVEEGATLDDFKQVVDNKCANWNREPEKGEKDMRPYLRPETLFGTKFQAYLNETLTTKPGWRNLN